MPTIKERLDSWRSAMTGLGDALRDKTQSVFFQTTTIRNDAQLLNLFHQEDIAARICDSLPRAALRPGFALSAEDEDTALASALDEYGKQRKFKTALRKAAIWARVLGGACIYVGVDDGQSEDQPVRESAIASISFVSVLDKRMLIPKTYYTTVERFGEIETYEVQKIALGGGSRVVQMETGSLIHESRLIRFDGELTEELRRANNNGWSYSVLERVHEVLRSFGVSWQAVGHLMQDASQGVFEIENLIEMIGSNDKNALATRMQLVDMSRSVARAIMLDAGREKFHRESYSFAGVADVLNLFMVRMASAARMPVTVLMGQSPTGMNATGESDLRLWYDQVQEYQTDEIAPAIERFWSLVFAAEDFDGEAPEAWSVQFGRLWQKTDKEQAEVEKITADKDKIYIDTGVVLPEEIAVNRFRASGFSQDTQIDLEAREEMRQAELDLAREKAGEEPEPPPIPGAVPPNPEPDPERVDRQDRIGRRNGKWIVKSRDGKKILGEHDTQEQAERQLRAIEARKNGKKRR